METKTINPLQIIKEREQYLYSIDNKAIPNNGVNLFNFDMMMPMTRFWAKLGGLI